MNYKKNTNFDFENDEDHRKINSYDNGTYSPIKYKYEYNEDQFSDVNYENSNSDSDENSNSESDGSYESEEIYEENDNRIMIWNEQENCFSDKFILNFQLLMYLIFLGYKSNHQEYFVGPTIIFFMFSFLITVMPFFNNFLRGYSTPYNIYHYLFICWIASNWISFLF